MSDETANQAELAEKILQTAREEADKILADARSSIDSRKKALEARVQSIRHEADERVATQVRELTSRADATIETARTRSRLRIEKRVYRQVEQQAVERIKAMRGQPEYNVMIRRWIVEAVVGIDTDRATVLCPPEDLETVKSVLAEAAKELSEQRGSKADLRIDETTPVVGQGVIARDESGRIAFSNLIADRIRRYAGRIRKATYYTVFGEENG